VAARLGDDGPVRHALRLLAAGGHPAAQRAQLAVGGPERVARWLSDCFLRAESG